jgi:D-ribose pyranase
MLRHGIIHAELSHHLARLRHTDRLCIADSGLPIPRSVPCIDLGLTYGFPGFIDVLKVVISPIVWQRAIVASQLAIANSTISEELLSVLSPTVPDTVGHEEFKSLLDGVAFVVRTGEATPYANVIFEAGVPF